MPRRALSLVGLGAVAAACAAAAVGFGKPPGKSGGAAATELVLVSADDQGRGAAIAAAFARRVDERSRGAVRVSVVAAAGSEDPVARVRSGSADLAIAPSEAFARLHVHTLDALRVPFLITTDDLAARATDAPFADRLLAGLDAASLHGLGLVPESLYRPFGFLKPLTSASDFSGLRISAPRSPAIRDVLRALGARPVDAALANAPSSAVYAGFGLSSPGRRASDTFPRDAYTASNVALFPKIDVVVASRAAFGRLSSHDRDVLAAAVRDVRADVVAANGTHAADRAFCDAGGAIEAAPPSDLRALRERTAPLRAELARDARTRMLIAEIGRLAAGSGASCGSAPTATPSEPPGGVGNDVRSRVVPPPGSYRHAFTVSELRAAGASEAEAQADAGVLTLTFWGWIDKRRFALEWPHNRQPACRGHVFWPRSVVELRWNPATPCTGYAAFGWRRAGDDIRIIGVGKATTARWARLLQPATWKRVDCDPLEASSGVEPGRDRPCPGGAEREALSHEQREAPSTSPDGKQMVVETELEDAQGLVIGKPNGTDLRWLTHHSRTGRRLTDDAWPAFSPDGDWIVFIRARWDRGKPWGTDGVALFATSPAGSRLRRLTPFATWAQLPRRLGFSLGGRAYAIKRNDAQLTWVGTGAAPAPER